jgi:hypothetical protein
MAAKKPVYRLVHNTFGDVALRDGFTTSSGNKILVCEGEAFDGRKLLQIDSEYWSTSAEEVSEHWRLLSERHAKFVAAEKTKQEKRDKAAQRAEMREQEKDEETNDEGSDFEFAGKRKHAAAD